MSVHIYVGAGRDQKVLEALELELQEVGWKWNPGSVEEQEVLLMEESPVFPGPG